MAESKILIEPEALEEERRQSAVRVIDVSKIETHAQLRIRGQFILTMLHLLQAFLPRPAYCLQMSGLAT